MKKQLILSIIVLLIFSAGCSGKKALKRSEETIPLPPAETKAVPDNETQLLETTGLDEDIETEGLPETEQQPAFPKKDGPAGDTAPEYRERAGEEHDTMANDDAGEKISLNFDNADIDVVISALSDLLGLIFFIDSSVKGRVNIHMTDEIEKSRLLSILETIFEMNNIALVKFGDFYKIVPVKVAKTKIIDINIGREIHEIPSYDRVIIQIVPLHYVSSSEIIKLIKPFAGKGGDMIDYKKGNFIIITDTTITVQRLLNLINIIDTDVFERTNIRFFKIKNAEVKDIAKELENIFSSFGIRKSTDKGIGLKFIPIERVSCVLAISPIPEVFKKVEYWLEVLDTIDLEAEEQIFIYFVENGKADEIADVLKKVYGEGSTQRTTKKPPRKKTKAKVKRTPPTRKAEGIGTIAGKIKIVTDDTTNSIIVRATPHDYSIIKETMIKLDIIPKQVLIEVLIAEVTLSGDTQFGVEWSLLGDSTEIGGYKGQDMTEMVFGMGGLGADLAQNLARGFTYRFNSNRLQAFLLAQASKNKLNILSSPHILAADNKEARIEVGQEVPIITSEYVPQGVQADISTSRNIEYRSTGVILTVTPRINEKGLVAMEISQEVSEAQPVVAGGIQSPVISNRKAETSLVVQDGQTIVIAGLIKDQTSKTISGVPILSSIPLLSYFFSDTKKKNEKIELCILITPHVVRDLNEIDMVTNEFRERLGQIKKMIYRSGDYWEGYE